MSFDEYFLSIRATIPEPEKRSAQTSFSFPIFEEIFSASFSIFSIRLLLFPRYVIICVVKKSLFSCISPSQNVPAILLINGLPIASRFFASELIILTAEMRYISKSAYGLSKNVLLVCAFFRILHKKRFLFCTGLCAIHIL